MKLVLNRCENNNDFAEQAAECGHNSTFGHFRSLWSLVLSNWVADVQNCEIVPVVELDYWFKLSHDWSLHQLNSEFFTHNGPLFTSSNRFLLNPNFLLSVLVKHSLSPLDLSDNGLSMGSCMCLQIFQTNWVKNVHWRHEVFQVRLRVVMDLWSNSIVNIWNTRICESSLVNQLLERIFFQKLVQWLCHHPCQLLFISDHVDLLLCSDLLESSLELFNSALILRFLLLSEQKPSLSQLLVLPAMLEQLSCFVLFDYFNSGLFKGLTDEDL